MVNAPATVGRLAGARSSSSISCVGDVGEVHDGRGDVAAVPPGADVDQAVPGVQHAGASAHAPPALDAPPRSARLAECLAVELEQRVAAEHERGPVDALPATAVAFAVGEACDELGRAAPGR